MNDARTPPEQDAPRAAETADATDTTDGRAARRAIALMNQKGGVGKTTTTVNLAAALAELGKRTLLIDLDPQAHATLHLGVDPDQLERSVYDLLFDPDVDPNEVVVETRENLHLLPAEVNLAAAEMELAAEQDRQRRITLAVRRLKTTYDYVLIDCPPSLGLLTLNALAFADEVFVPMQAHFLALQGVGKLLETVRLVSRAVNVDLRVGGVILCMHDEQSRHTREVVADLEAFFEQARGTDAPWANARVLRPAIRRNIKLAECPSFGQTIFEYARWCPGALDYRQMAEGLISDAAGVAEAAKPESTPQVVVRNKTESQRST